MVSYARRVFHCCLVGDDDIGCSGGRGESGTEEAELLDFEEGLEAGGFKKGIRKLLVLRGGGVQDAGVGKRVLHSINPNALTC